MFKSFFISSLIFVSFAQAQVLGEYSGPAELKIESRADGHTSKSETSCRMGMNIDWSESRFGLDFSAFTCGGQYSWNEAFAFEIVDNKLMDGSDVVGTVNETTGVVEFEIAWTDSKKVQEVQYDSDCRPLFIKNVTWKLPAKLRYKFTRSGSNYAIERVMTKDSVQNVFKKPYPNCNSVAVPVRAKTHLDLVGSVAKTL